MSAPQPIRKYSGFTTSQVSVPTVSAVQLFDDARTNTAEEEQGASSTPAFVEVNIGFRELKNLDAANPIYIGKDNTVTSATGHRVDPGQPFTLAQLGVLYLGPIYAIATGGAVNVSTVEF